MASTAALKSVMILMDDVSFEGLFCWEVQINSDLIKQSRQHQLPAPLINNSPQTSHCLLERIREGATYLGCSTHRKVLANL